MSSELIIALIGIAVSAISAIFGYKSGFSKHRFETSYGLMAKDQENKYEAHRLLWAAIAEWSTNSKKYVGKNRNNTVDWLDQFNTFWYSIDGILIDKEARKATFDVVDYLRNEVVEIETKGSKKFEFDPEKFNTLKRAAQKAIATTVGEAKNGGKGFRRHWLTQE